MEIDGVLYEVVRIINENHSPIVDAWREHLMCDKVFRRDGMLYFCRTVQDVQIEQ